MAASGTVCPGNWETDWHYSHGVPRWVELAVQEGIWARSRADSWAEWLVNGSRRTAPARLVWGGAPGARAEQEDILVDRRAALSVAVAADVALTKLLRPDPGEHRWWRARKAQPEPGGEGYARGTVDGGGPAYCPHRRTIGELVQGSTEYLLLPLEVGGGHARLAVHKCLRRDWCDDKKTTPRPALPERSA